MFSLVPVKFIFNPCYIYSSFSTLNVAAKSTLPTSLIWVVFLVLSAFAIILFSVTLHPDSQGFFLKWICYYVTTKLKIL